MKCVIKHECLNLFALLHSITIIVVVCRTTTVVVASVVVVFTVVNLNCYSAYCTE